MARRCFGYGRWDAPYWFIGPEQGQGSEDLGLRLKAWCDLGSTELCDLDEFHQAINEHRWERILQPTWKKLILLLMTFLDRAADTESLRRYQRFEWGRLKGENCIIELSGLAAHNLRESRDDRERFLQERIEVIRERLRQAAPLLVVMYGITQRKSWEEIAGRAFPAEDIMVSGGTTLAVAAHPNYKWANAYWVERGQQLREAALKAGAKI